MKMEFKTKKKRMRRNKSFHPAAGLLTGAELCHKYRTKFTLPPPRYRGFLIKAMEEDGIGRPTYAPTISTILERATRKERDNSILPIGPSGHDLPA